MNICFYRDHNALTKVARDDKYNIYFNMQDSYLIKGGKKLKGEVRLSGAKNVALKAVIAALLFDGPVILENVPQIDDVFELLYLIKDLGGEAEFIEKNKVKVNGQSLKTNRLDLFRASKIRVSFMLFAPLLYKFEAAYIPNPGGCRIGARPIDRIIDGMTTLGINVDYDSETGYYYAKMTKLPQGSYGFPKPSHTGTELLILLSVFTKEKVVIENAALEPEIDELIKFLNEGGADITREKNKITIKGIKKLNQKKHFVISSDRNEAITYVVLALATQGEVIISPIKENQIQAFLQKLKEAGAGIENLSQNKWRFYYHNQLKATNIETTPYPGFMTDWQPPWAVLMTQAAGESTIHERVFENRFAYVDELKKLGAKIKSFEPKVDKPEDFYYFNYDFKKAYCQMIKIMGNQKLHNGVLAVTDLRAGATLVIAALTAQGESIISNASIIDRGYEDFVKKIQKLGGDVKKT